nr:caspase-3-like [Crassostrea gigas]
MFLTFSLSHILGTHLGHNLGKFREHACRSARINSEPLPAGLFDWERETSYPVQSPVNESRSYSVELDSMSSKYSLQSIEQRYTMDSDPRGAVLIINNRRFANNHKERLGTEQDCRNLKLLFEELGFHVYVKEDLRSFEILRDCKDFAKDPILAKVDCMVLAVLSHGTADNVICGADAKMINVMDEICPIFSPLRCPYLSGKPKMYIFNACRGDSFYLPNEVGGYRSQVLENQDILFCYSTFPGYASYRDPDRGSWFVQEFVEVFREQANEEHVIDMLTEVNKRVSQKNHTDNSLEASCVQIPCPATSLTKKWYLNPLGAISLGH